MFAAMQVNRNIFLVDDDASIRHSLSLYLDASGYSVKAFPSAESFLEGMNDAIEGVILLDQKLARMTGLELQDLFAKRGIDLPIIFITGHGDVQMSVKAIKTGAIDFIEKPFKGEALLESIGEAFKQADISKIRTELWKRCISLTKREREVMEHVIAGKTSKKIAELLDISKRTIEVHRLRVMEKMDADSLPDLVRKCDMCNVPARI